MSLPSCTGTDPALCLWYLDIATGVERLLVDPGDLVDDVAVDRRPWAEEFRRECAREHAWGIVAFAADRAVRTLCFAVGGQVWRTDIDSVTTIPLAHGVSGYDPRPDPTGNRVAYVCDGAVHVTDRDGSTDRVLLGPEHSAVTYGMAEYVALNTMHRPRGYWWSPDGQRLLVSRVDTNNVCHWYTTDLLHPDNPPQAFAYPPAGSVNADVSLHLVDLDGSRTPVRWDRDLFEYLVAVTWPHRGLLIVTQCTVTTSPRRRQSSAAAASSRTPATPNAAPYDVTGSNSNLDSVGDLVAVEVRC